MNGGLASDSPRYGKSFGIAPVDTGARRSGAKPELGFLFILVLPAVAALASFKNVTVLNTHYLAFPTLLIPLALFLLVLVKGGLDSSRIRLWPGHAGWLAWYAVVWCSLLWGESHNEEAVEFAFELSTPYIFAVAGVTFVRTEAQLATLLKAFLFALLVGVACVAAWKIGLVDSGSFASGPALDARPHSMSLLPIAAIAIAMIPGHLVIPAIVWTVCLLISAIEASRGATLCMLLMPLFHPNIRGLAWRGFALVAVIAMAGVVFQLPAMQARLFPQTGSGSIADLFASDVSGMGRFEAWPLILDSAMDRPVLGHGVSSAGTLVPKIWDRMESPHNEFLRIGYELGLLGLAVFGAAVAIQLVCLKRAIPGPCDVVTASRAGVYLSLIAFLIMACSDNPLASNIRLLNPVFLLLGASFGVSPPRSVSSS